MFKGILFDADGTLLDSMGMWETLGEKFLFSINKTPKNDFREKISTMTLEECAEYIKQIYFVDSNASNIKDSFINLIKDYYYKKVQLKSGMINFVNTIADLKIPMVVVTCNDYDLIEKSLKRLNIYDAFIEIITCSEIGEGKNSPKIYNEAVKKIDNGFINAKDYLVVEDSLYCIKTANKANYKTMAVNDVLNKNDWKEISKICDYIYNENFNIEQIKQILKN